MTLKTSSKTKSTQGFISGNRLWLISLFALISFLSYVVLFWFAVYNQGYRLSPSDTNYNLAIVQWRSTLTSWLSYQSLSTVFAVFYAFMLGVTSFNYLYKSKTVDFYFSMPKKKMTYFLEVCANSVLIYTAISAISYLCAILIYLAVGAPMDGELWGIVIHGFFANFVLFLSVYAICVLAQTLCGHTFISILLSIYFLSIELAIRGTIGLLADHCFMTYDLYGKESLGTNILPVLTSPIYNMVTEAGAPLFLKNLLIAAIAFGLAFVLYKKYKGEYAGKAVVSKGMRYLIKVSLACLAAIWIGFLFSEFSGTSIYGNIGFLIFGALLGSVIVSAICEIVFAFDIRAMFKRFWQAPMVAAAALVFMFSIIYDWYGYDSYVPEAKDVVDCAIAIADGEAANQYIIDENGEFQYANATEYAKEYMHLPYTDEVHEIAAIGMKQRRDWKTWEMDSAETVETDRDVQYDYDVSISYRMKNGKTYHRRISVPYDMDASILNSVIGSDEYKQVSFTLDTMDELRSITGGYNVLEFYDSVNKDISDEVVDEFFEAYQKDLKHWNFTVATEDLVLGEVYYSKNVKSSPNDPNYMPNYYYDGSVATYEYAYADEEEQTLFYQGFPVYESFVNTIAYLEEQGLYSTYMLKNPVAEDVAYLEVNKDDCTYIANSGWNMGDGESEHYYIYDPEEIETALESTVPAIGKSYSYHWHITKNYDSRYTVYIYLYDDSDNCYERAFLKGQAPEFLSNYETTNY